MEGMEAALKIKILAQDDTTMMRVLEMAIMYSEAAPHSAEMLRKIAEDYKGKVADLEEDHKKVFSAKDEEIRKKNGQLTTNTKSISEKDVSLLDLGYQLAFI